jgi:hypothetical protein
VSLFVDSSVLVYFRDTSHKGRQVKAAAWIDVRALALWQPVPLREPVFDDSWGRSRPMPAAVGTCLQDGHELPGARIVNPFLHGPGRAIPATVRHD